MRHRDTRLDPKADRRGSDVTPELELSDDDILDAMAEIPGYIDITTEDFRVIYHLAHAQEAAALAKELEGLPAFRRYGYVNAFGEGWGLYAESLGKELGVYTDPYQYFGALNAELWRAIRLVVDTGLHAKQWSRQDVLDFMYSNSAVKEARAVAEAERFMAIPGQALAYKIGQQKIREIRDNAEERLGDRFDVKEFHAQVLMDGPMPLSMLENKIDSWVEGQL